MNEQNIRVLEKFNNCNIRLWKTFQISTEKLIICKYNIICKSKVFCKQSAKEVLLIAFFVFKTKLKRKNLFKPFFSFKKRK